MLWNLLGNYRPQHYFSRDSPYEDVLTTIYIAYFTIIKTLPRMILSTGSTARVFPEWLSHTSLGLSTLHSFPTIWLWTLKPLINWMSGHFHVGRWLNIAPKLILQSPIYPITILVLTVVLVAGMALLAGLSFSLASAIPLFCSSVSCIWTDNIKKSMSLFSIAPLQSNTKSFESQDVNFLIRALMFLTNSKA